MTISCSVCCFSLSLAPFVFLSPSVSHSIYLYLSLCVSLHDCLSVTHSLSVSIYLYISLSLKLVYLCDASCTCLNLSENHFPYFVYAFHFIVILYRPF